MQDFRAVEPLEHRRLRLHAFSASLGLIGGVAMTAGGGYAWGIILGPSTGFLLAPVFTRWLLPKRLGSAAWRVIAACIVVCAGAGFLPHALLAWTVGAAGTLVATWMFTSSLPDIWPPDPSRCGGCGYDLRGTPGDICPECGLELRVIACVECGYSLRGLPRPICPECGHDNTRWDRHVAGGNPQGRASGEARDRPAVRRS